MITLGGHTPEIDPSAWIAPGAVVAGRVRIGAEASVWYTCVLRAELETITIGARTNLQDGTVVHCDPGFPCTVGTGVSVGHRVVLHGCTVEDDVLVGMGAVVMNGARIGSGSIVAAGAVVTQGVQIPPNSLVAGVPAKVRAATDEAARNGIALNAAAYLHLQRVHRDAT
ncbi:gamma carbonic anhydrase family protein [Pseudonocardia pini]|uniref:gamma carbonic anhydrase family protein n=1 Tax=Pseudonocardia pini TaxID=2758030 RepID=UPI0015F0EEC6|nr:gamma carbonic anhydrase family protein [Pseudonocardia pini]